MVPIDEYEGLEDEDQFLGDRDENGRLVEVSGLPTPREVLGNRSRSYVQ